MDLKYNQSRCFHYYIVIVFSVLWCKIIAKFCSPLYLLFLPVADHPFHLTLSPTPLSKVMMAKFKNIDFSRVFLALQFQDNKGNGSLLIFLFLLICQHIIIQKTTSENITCLPSTHSW